MEPSGWGIYKTTFTPTRPGIFKMEPIVSAYGEKPLPSTTSLEVTRADLERNFLAQDRNMLQSIADASGGKYFQINEIDELATAIPEKIDQRMLTAEYNPCRHWIYYAVLASAMAIAWTIRKRSGLA